MDPHCVFVLSVNLQEMKRQNVEREPALGHVGFGGMRSLSALRSLSSSISLVFPPSFPIRPSHTI